VILHTAKHLPATARLLLPLLCAALLLTEAARPDFAEAASATPLDALVNAQKGIDRKDSDLFNQSVDVATVVDRASDELLAVMRDQAAADRVDAGNIGMILALTAVAEDAGQTPLIKQLLVSEVKTFIAAGINQGYFAGTPDKAVKLPHGSLASALPKMPTGRREIRPGKILSESGDSATISAAFLDPAAGRLPLELAMERRQGHWRVVEILNARSLFDQAVKHAR
jgi:hypothetical protein